MGDLRDDLIRLAAADAALFRAREVMAKIAKHDRLPGKHVRDELDREVAAVDRALSALRASHPTRTGAAPLIVPSAPSPRSEAEGAAHHWIETSDPMTPMCAACGVRDGDPAADQPCRAPVPAESATTAKCANRYHPFCDEAGAGGCYPCRACGGKTEISYPTANGLKWRPCPECAATKGEEDGR